MWHQQYSSASLYCLCHNLGEALVRTCFFLAITPVFWLDDFFGVYCIRGILYLYCSSLFLIICNLVLHVLLRSLFDVNIGIPYFAEIVLCLSVLIAECTL